MKILIVSGTVCNGSPARKGTVVSTDPKQGAELIAIGKAVLYEEEKKANRPKNPTDRQLKPTKKRDIKPLKKN